MSERKKHKIVDFMSPMLGIKFFSQFALMSLGLNRSLSHRRRLLSLRR